MAVQLLGFPTTLGLPRRARQHAPEALRSAGLLETLRRHCGRVEDLGDLPLPEGDRTQPWPDQVRHTVAAARTQAHLWRQAHKPGQLMMTIGGDHSTSLGTLQALTDLGYDYDTVWIDAHGDFNILHTSPSGNTHGMVLALACGLMPEYMPAVVHPSSLRLWGIRDLDPGERDLLRQQSVEVLSPDQVRHEWDRIVMRLKPNVFLSFDMDSVEPAHAPGTMTPVPGGFGRHEALELVGHLARHRQIIAMDLVEYHPDYDHDDRTLELARAVLATALTGRAERVASSGFAAAAD
ncbi:MAG TPA: arginase family protein [Symbiobacteriaceae bacterium]|nr:arginase family protein [Symbiobacteriaceae bacterium]